MKDNHLYAVYILASKPYGTLYIGVTNDLIRRVHEHKIGVVSCFTKRYGVTRLAYFEYHTDITLAIAREKRLKRWRRIWKIELIEQENPVWLDLYNNFMAENKRRAQWETRAVA